jgi:hypothetical protein
MLDFGALLYDPLYDSFGVAAVITPAGTGAGSASVTAIDHTAGVEVRSSHGSASIELGTVRPVADVRKYELAARGLTVADLDGATIALNGKTWRIKSYYPKGDPHGEDAGELRLILLVDS